jgi:ribonuclease HI
MSSFPKTNILQWNSRSLVANKHEFINILNEYDIKIAAISETWLSPDSSFSVSSFNCIRDDRPDGRGGAALLIHASIPFQRINIPTNSDLQIVGVVIRGIAIISAYIPPLIQFDENYWNAVISAYSSNIIVLGDFNAHSPIWGSPGYNRSGYSIMSFADYNNLCILNDGSPTRLTAPNRNISAVDISLSSSNIASISTWSILKDPYSSDHFPIILSVGIDTNYNHNLFQHRNKYNISKANWSNFQNSILNSIQKVSYEEINQGDINKKYRMLTEVIDHAAESSIPIRGPRKQKKPVRRAPWWDTECSDIVYKRSDAMKKYRQNMCLETFLEAKKCQAQAKKLLRKKKKQGWVNFCSSLSPRTSISVVWNSIRSFRYSCSSSNVSPSQGNSWIDSFADKLAPPSVPFSSDLTLNIPKHQYSNDNNWIGDPFILSELIFPIKYLNNSSPGVDNIPNIFFKKIPKEFLPYVLDFFNTCLEVSEVPDGWKLQKVVPILKPGKDPTSGSSYRPIALSSCFLKLLERLLKYRIEWYVEHNKILSEYQFGFRRGRSSMDNVSILTTDIQIAFTKQEYTFAVFLDIDAAYDNVPISILHNKLMKIGLPYNVCKLIFNMLSDRSLSIVSRSSPPIVRKVWRGILQGSVLSPLLFNIFCSDLHSSIDPSCKILMYADDIVIYTSHKNHFQALNSLKSSLVAVDKWFWENGLTLSPDKSQFVIFSRKHRLPDNVNLTINNIPIVQRDQVKFLGVILDRKLSWKEYTNYLVTKCERNLNPLRAVSRVWWGCHPATMKMFFDCWIRSQWDYASFIFHSLPNYLETRIEVVLNKGLRLIVGAMRSTPINSLQVECGEMPFSIRRQYLSDRFLLKRFILKNNILVESVKKLINLFRINQSRTARVILPPLCISYDYLLSHFNHLAESHRALPGYDMDFDAATFDAQIVENIGLNKGDQFISSKFQIIMNEKWPSFIRIYTDGSKIPSNANFGCSVVIPTLHINNMYKINPPSSVFTAECIALREALESAINSNQKNFIILSDSLSAIQLISTKPIYNPSNTFLASVFNLLHQLRTDGKNIVLAWIPGHSGISGNEKADESARRAIDDGVITSYCEISNVNLAISKRTQKSWYEMWMDPLVAKGRHYKNVQNFIPTRPWFISRRGFSKRHISIISRMRLGHCCIASHLFKIKVLGDPHCECGEEETLDHVLLSCPNNTPLDLSGVKNIMFPLSASYILSLDDRYCYKAIVKFININNIKI